MKQNLAKPLFFICLAICGFGGCDSNSSNTDLTSEAVGSLSEKSTPGDDESNQPNATQKEPALVSVNLGRREDLDALVAKHSGKVVLVDFWATWCGPCIQQFPHTIALSQKNRDHLAVIAVSMDEPEDIERVQQFVNERKADFEHLISEYGVGQEGFEAFEITNGSIPHYKLFDRQGKLRHTVEDNSEVDSLIEQLLSEQ